MVWYCLRTRCVVPCMACRTELWARPMTCRWAVTACDGPGSSRRQSERLGLQDQVFTNAHDVRGIAEDPQGRLGGEDGEIGDRRVPPAELIWRRSQLGQHGILGGGDGRSIGAVG